MDVSSHMGAGAVPELDLSAGCHPYTIVDKINAMPALKTSTAFFTFLRANLVLPHSAMSSNVSTPYLEPHTSQTLPLPSPSPLASNPPLTAIDDIPPLSLDVLTSHDDKVSALKLVADSIAQQRQQASSSLATHPLLLSALAACLVVVYRYAWRQQNYDIGTVMMLACGAVMTYLLGIRYFASGYLKAADSLRWDWLLDEHGEEDVIIGTRFGSELIGALVLHIEPNISFGGKKKKGSISMKGGKGVVRAWTTKLKYRGKGIGENMLREAVKISQQRCGRDVEVGFAASHANSVKVLPEMFNGVFRKGEMRAARALEGVVGKSERKR
ncbi:hypothetical protein QBC34DRAFT_393201 [Podospora aff. communis PSN243]|uniref:N-acetyltransferase domain-containing protein n=1 Tax=Podospora aff. communis PSN243 TaxID=3040156 RepID=A0AAV9H1Z7_9PEZI|nr:hypothetical protein QBC34DRAFT_393201 [Podospora aff. communis PSN243]